MSDNPNCDGANCSSDTGDVRLYPLGAEPLRGNMILCISCWAHENAFRLDRDYDQHDDWPLHDWNDAKPYPQE